MDVVIAGSHGLIGSALVPLLRSQGHRVRVLVRRTPESAHEIGWDPDRGELDPADLAGVEAAVNLAGAGLGDTRWTESYRRTILSSRVRAAATLATALAGLDTPPAALLQASAVGAYGDRGEEVLTEGSARGDGFLADVVAAWEGAAAPAASAGIRVAYLRTGIVLAPRGGAAGRLLPLLRLGLGGPLGSGRQWWSWITLVDEVSAIAHLLTADVAGPVNLCSPTPARNAEVVGAMAAALHRPAVLRVPGFALRLAIGGFAEDILASQRMAPVQLQTSGYAYAHPDLPAAAAYVTGTADRSGH